MNALRRLRQATDWSQPRSRRGRRQHRPRIEALDARVLLSADILTVANPSAAEIAPAVPDPFLTQLDRVAQTMPRVGLSLGSPPRARVYQFQPFAAKVGSTVITPRTEQELIAQVTKAAGGAAYALYPLAALVPAFRDYMAKVDRLADRSISELKALTQWYQDASKQTANAYTALRDQAAAQRQLVRDLAQRLEIPYSSLQSEQITRLEHEALGLRRMAQAIDKTLEKLSAKLDKLKEVRDKAVSRGDTVAIKQATVDIWANRVQQNALRTKQRQFQIAALARQVKADSLRLQLLEQRWRQQAGETPVTPETIEAEIDPIAEALNPAADFVAPQTAAIEPLSETGGIPPVSPVPPVNPDPDDPKQHPEGPPAETPEPPEEPQPPEGWPPVQVPVRPPYAPPIPMPGGGETWTAMKGLFQKLKSRIDTTFDRIKQSIGGLRVNADDLRRLGQLTLGTTEVLVGGTLITVGVTGEGASLVGAPVTGGGTLVGTVPSTQAIVLGAGLVTNGMMNVQQALVTPSSSTSLSTSLFLFDGQSTWVGYY